MPVLCDRSFLKSEETCGQFVAGSSLPGREQALAPECEPVWWKLLHVSFQSELASLNDSFELTMK